MRSSGFENQLRVLESILRRGLSPAQLRQLRTVLKQYPSLIPEKGETLLRPAGTPVTRELLDRAEALYLDIFSVVVELEAMRRRFSYVPSRSPFGLINGLVSECEDLLGRLQNEAKAVARITKGRK